MYELCVECMIIILEHECCSRARCEPHHRERRAQHGPSPDLTSVDSTSSHPPLANPPHPISNIASSIFSRTGSRSPGHQTPRRWGWRWPSPSQCGRAARRGGSGTRPWLLCTIDSWTGKEGRGDACWPKVLATDGAAASTGPGTIEGGAIDPFCLRGAEVALDDGRSMCTGGQGASSSTIRLEM